MDIIPILTAILATASASCGQQDLATVNQHANYTPPWATMPPRPAMPPSRFNGTAPVNGIDLWYATYGATLNDSQAAGLSPVVFLHGGAASSDWWSNQLRYFKDSAHTIIAIDSRGQGRSNDDFDRPLTYDQMTEDVVALMDFLDIPRFSTVGWSDGSCISFDLAMNYSSRIDRIFAFGGTYSPANINESYWNAPTTAEANRLTQEDYERLSPYAGSRSYEQFEARIGELWSSGPTWSAPSFSKIPTLYSRPDAPLIWIVAGDSEESVTMSTPGELHSWIWGSALVSLPSVSHYAMIQDPAAFNVMLERLLQIKR